MKVDAILEEEYYKRGLKARPQYDEALVGADLSAKVDPTTNLDPFVPHHYRPFSSITLMDVEPLEVKSDVVS